jgi:hypothetical protein
MKLGSSKIGKDLTRSEAGSDEGVVGARVEILPSRPDGLILLFPDETGPDERGKGILNSLRLAFNTAELVEKVREESLILEDLVQLLGWNEEAIGAFRPNKDVAPLHPAHEGVVRPLSLLRGNFVEFSPIVPQA